MSLSRRSFLASSAAALWLPRAGLAASPAILRAAPVTAQILPEGDGVTEMLGYNGSTPGPELRYRQGDTLDLRFENAIGDGSAVHWHGIRIDNAMDGVPYLTQTMVEDGESFDYRFSLPDAGTYWYHSHNRSWEQVARGLYGPLIIEEANPPAVDHDITVIVDDWRIERTGEMIEDFGSRHDFSHAGRLGSFARIIASVDQVRRGDRVRLRLINTATARIFPLELSGIEGKIVALDGMGLATPAQIGRLMIAPAQRVDILAHVTDTIAFTFPTRGEPYPMGEIKADGDNPTPITEPIPALPAADVPRPAAEPNQTATLTLQGGAMGGRHAGDDIWALNGISNLPDAPWRSFKRGETVRLSLVNETAFPHGIHLHGHHFHEVLDDGSLGPLRDTSLVMREQRRDIVCVFDNPGKWLLHCHMLGHQAAGMKTWVEVV
ncbi:FtsP/CotA-like multicopper oxidase with cupredoxin domain [Litoreibacter ponti]|uniref:FtsP/CotA-like multicopper oxidase with cupredoxin domain n=1 Tax=Litoreibacter ponti TaxID=1510457 RepID=A0A2T6BJ58_9RHOB|nr:multicopper oxidase family protein [Litoreibacter ponti]PTX56086.1 FtsP/CotA-like multicopper oxidase with cupredoxin domain [Litoreibacter ponti]